MTGPDSWVCLSDAASTALEVGSGLLATIKLFGKGLLNTVCCSAGYPSMAPILLTSDSRSGWSCEYVTDTPVSPDADAAPGDLSHLWQ